MTTTTKFDVDELRQAVESADPDAQLAFYADDAEVTLVDRDHPPSNPIRLHGHGEIREWLADVAGRDMKHQVTMLAVNGDTGGYRLDCRYSSGEKVACAALFELSDGRISKLEGVQAWDS
jgi:ketosteroid isomerase-like protein